MWYGTNNISCFANFAIQTSYNCMFNLLFNTTHRRGEDDLKYDSIKFIMKTNEIAVGKCSLYINFRVTYVTLHFGYYILHRLFQGVVVNGDTKYMVGFLTKLFKDQGTVS